MYRSLTIALVLTLFALLPAAAMANPPVWKVGVAEGWPILLPHDDAETVFAPSNFRIGISAGWRIGDSDWSISIKPRLIIPHTGFRPNPGIIAGVGRKLSDAVSWSWGVLYQLSLPYQGADIGQLLSLGTGPVFQITPGVAVSPSIALGKTIDGPWSVAVQPIELTFVLP